jgi:hypothetical protein
MKQRDKFQKNRLYADYSEPKLWWLNHVMKAYLLAKAHIPLDPVPSAPEPQGYWIVTLDNRRAWFTWARKQFRQLKSSKVSNVRLQAATGD